MIGVVICIIYLHKRESNQFCDQRGGMFLTYLVTIICIVYSCYFVDFQNKVHARRTRNTATQGLFRKPEHT